MPTETSALDVAKFIINLSKNIGEPVTNMKLQKLVFYSYVWYLVETGGEKLYKDPIIAWQYGPVVLNVYNKYKPYGADTIKQSEDGDLNTLNSMAKEIIEDVFNIYGGMNGIELANLTHSEQPWMQTYEEGKNNIIPDELIFEFYKAKRERTDSSNEQA